jgi:Mn2+/Fe2+ NRAMP family transporter
MTDHPHRHNRPTHDELHPLVYKMMVALTIWLLLSVWVLFGGAPYSGLTFAMVTLFFVVFIAVPVLLWLAWRRNADPHDTRIRGGAFRDWTTHKFITWTGRLSGREAAVQILLPLAAVSIGMTIFGLVYYFDVPHAGY